ncbi:hypothetical protein SAMN02745221_00553 [Thermosyntropha lipolytica DSM 11003]|uniref:Uncharacterized protein n=1 Tax=Thermosyntropha lipolytica DSM 11003 TaxID=1123382 RepID=A0A1M5L1B7_9FIRM|nr:hypothetical protein [Thermosyntropha lipolytica]SHG58884.1 hypothetical protein SAMN02745221_00553 [Thermosyntropha lipolytica DSM 11003]
MDSNNYPDYSLKPKKIVLSGEDLRDEYVFEEMWLWGDDKERDLVNLIEQNRLPG